MAGDLTWWCIFIGSFLVAFCVSAMCSLAESVLLSLSTAQIIEIGKKNPKIGSIWEGFRQDPDGPITSILAVNTTAHTIGASFAGAAFAHIFDESWIWVFSLVFTFLMLQYTEILPKTFGIRHNQVLAFWIARPLNWTTKAGDPIIHFLRFLNKPFEKKIEKDEPSNAVKEITLLTSMARSRSLLDNEQEKIILAALKLSKTKVSEVMVPIDETSFLSCDMTFNQTIETARSDSHTRFPVYLDENNNLIVGYVNFKELLANSSLLSETPIENGEEHAGLNRFVHEIMQVNASDKASNILYLLVKNHEHIALVMGDDKKTYLGILTLEDLIEELVGEIEDEFDRLPESISWRLGMLRVGGGATLENLVSQVKKNFYFENASCIEELSSSDKTTRVSDWIEERLEEPMSRNARVSCGELDFWVKRVRRGRVFDVLVMNNLSFHNNVEDHMESVEG